MLKKKLGLIFFQVLLSLQGSPQVLLGIGEVLHLSLQLKTESVRVEVLTFKRAAHVTTP